MKKKKIISTVLLSFVLVNNYVYADFGIGLENGIITINGNTNPDERVTAIVVKENSTATTDAYKALDFNADGDGNYQKSFSIYPKENKIKVDVFVREGNSPITKKSFVYITEEKMVEFIADLKASCEDKTGTATRNIFDNSDSEMKYFGLDTEDYNLLSPELRLVAGEIFANEAVDFEASEEIKNTFYKGTGIGLVNWKGDFKVCIEKYHQYILRNELYEKLKDDNALTLWCGEFIEGQDIIKSTQELEKNILKAEALYTINNCEYTDFEALLNENKELLELEMLLGQAFEELSASNKIKVAKITLQKLSATPAKNAEELSESIIKSIEEITKSTSTGNVSGGSTGGSGSSSGKKKPSSVGVISGAVLNTTVTEEQINEPLKPVEYLPFADVGNDFWAREAIYAMYDKKIISGFEDETFRPNALLTREQFVVMVDKAFNIKADTTVEFSDVAENEWYKESIAKCFNSGIIRGMSDDIFGVGRNITRQDMAVILDRAMNISGITLEEKRELLSFFDFDEAADYAQESIKALYCKEIISGDENNMLRPLGNATRAEAAMMLYNILK